MLILLRMFQLAGDGGSSYRREALKISHKTGSLAAIRGRIYSADGELLVWSERSYDLRLNTRNLTPERRKLLEKNLRSAPIADLPLQLPLRSGTIKYNLTANELAAADSLSTHFPEFSVELRWERLSSTPLPDAGEVRQLNGMEYGVSGWEKEYDRQLCGTAGQFTVMLDRRGRWINPTFRITTPPRPGKDVRLNQQEDADD